MKHLFIILALFIVGCTVNKNTCNIQQKKLQSYSEYKRGNYVKIKKEQITVKKEIKPNPMFR